MGEAAVWAWMPIWWRSRWVRLRGEQGFSSLELVAVIPVLFAFLLLVVGFGRATHGSQLVDQAAAAGARAAALEATPAAARASAQREATDTLDQAGMSCQQVRVEIDTAGFRPGGEVSVRVSCVADLSDLVVVGFPGSLTLDARSTAPLETYRQYGAGVP